MTPLWQWRRWRPACLSLLAAALLCFEAAAAPKGARWGPNYFPNYEVTAHTGQKFKFYDDLIKDKIVLINFIYTNCTDICPLVTARLLRLLDEYGPAELELALVEVNGRGVVHVPAVRAVLERRRHAKGRPAPVAVALPDDPRIRELVVRPHDLATYDHIDDDDGGDDGQHEDA